MTAPQTRLLLTAALIAAAALATQTPSAIAQSTRPPVGSTSAPAAPKLTPIQQQLLAKAHRHEKAGWIILHSEGAPRERGSQHGYLLTKEIAEALRIRRAVWYHNTAMEWADLLKETTRFVTPSVDAENREVRSASPTTSSPTTHSWSSSGTGCTRCRRRQSAEPPTPRSTQSRPARFRP